MQLNRLIRFSLFRLRLVGVKNKATDVFHISVDVDLSELTWFLAWCHDLGLDSFIFVLLVKS
jgi:hypothetical protein